MKYFSYILILLISLFLVFGGVAQAASPVSSGLNTAAQEGGLASSSERSKSATDLANERIGQVIKAVLSLIGVIFMLVIIYGGLLWMTAGGVEDRVSKAKKYLVNAVIGLALVALAYAAVNFAINTVGSQTLV